MFSYDIINYYKSQLLPVYVLFASAREYAMSMIPLICLLSMTGELREFTEKLSRTLIYKGHDLHTLTNGNSVLL